MIGSRSWRSIGWTRRLALVLIVATSLGGSFGSSLTSAQKSDSFRFAFWGDPAERAAYEQVIAGFEASHAGIDVEIDYTPGQSDFLRKVATDFAAGTPPDVFLINYRQYGQYAASGALQPVEPYLAASDAISADEYAQISMDAFKYRGGDQVCMPQNVSSLVVYYNVDLFKANNVPLPTAGWTWDQFIAAAEALTQDTDGDGTTDLYGVAVEPVMYRFVSFIWSAGGEVVDNLNNPTTLTLDTPEAIDGIEKFISLGVTGHNVVPSEEEVAAEDDGARFMRGGAAMFLQSRREVPTLREINGFTWDVAPLPTINEPATVLHSDAFCMAAATENKDAVWSFIEYAAGEEGQLILADTGRIVPARLSVLTSDVFLKGMPIDGGSPTAAEPKPPASSQVFVDNIAIMHRLPSISTWPEVEDAFDAEFDRSFYVAVDVPAAIATVTANAKAAFDRAAAEDAKSSNPSFLGFARDDGRD
ncbi:MAG TPA: sugar ABC transporter substrate-binding protein [Thermomicrobiales bacterium]|jgi:multiple sugar transport system substrate-binding protein